MIECVVVWDCIDGSLCVERGGMYVCVCECSWWCAHKCMCYTTDDLVLIL